MKRPATMALAVLATACGDGEPSTAGTSTGGHGGGGTSSAATGGDAGPIAVSSSATSTTTTGAGGAGPDPYGCISGSLPERPPSIPEGWRPWACWRETPDCLVWIAEDPETMVTPIEWEPCAEGSPVIEGCQQMVRSWPFDSYGAIGTADPGAPQLDVRSDPPLLQMLRISVQGTGSDTSYAEWIAAEPDGVVRYAMRKPFPKWVECAYGGYDLNEGFWILSTHGDGTLPISESPHDGAMLIDVLNQDVRLIYSDDKPGSSSWRAGRSWIARWTASTLHLHDHAFEQDIPVQEPSTDPFGAGPAGRIQVLDDKAVWEVSASGTLGIRAYDPERGPHDLIRFLDDPTHGAGTPGTDGVDLVWMEGRGREAGDVTYPIRDVMTSPFTTDPAALEPRRLRSDPSTSFGLSQTGYRVACGHAAKTGATPQDVQIVRLSDGHAWRILHTDLVWKQSTIVGLTCDEIFLVVQFSVDGESQGSTIQRIRLDALGEGIPPD